MTLSAERLEIANRRIQQTFARSSIAWQAIPHWDTGDPAQVQVRSDQVFVLDDPNDPNVVAAIRAAPPVPAAGGGPLGARPSCSWGSTCPSRSATRKHVPHPGRPAGRGDSSQR